ncbi:hypothetical protein G6F63_014838 [Rhizopus arrhizus]|nr:hypothetical protein G6F63_014838 [Rhizopus arrhizus]
MAATSGLLNAVSSMPRASVACSSRPAPVTSSDRSLVLLARQTELRGTKAVFGFHQLLHLPHTLHAHLAVRRTAACTDLRPGVLQLGFTAALGPRIGLPPGEMGPLVRGVSSKTPFSA